MLRKELVENNLELKPARIIVSECPVYGNKNFDFSECKECHFKGCGASCSYCLVFYDDHMVAANRDMIKEKLEAQPPLSPTDCVKSTVWTFPCALCGERITIASTEIPTLWRGACGNCPACGTSHVYIRPQISEGKTMKWLGRIFAIPNPKR